MSVVDESLGSLKSLGSPTEYWDDIMVYIIVSRLDSETHEAWEVQQGASVNPPKLHELRSFIDGRARALEGIEMRESMRPGSFPSIFKHQGNIIQKAKIHTSSINQAKPHISCLFCNENHYLSTCKAFSQKSPLQRRDYIISQKLCFNCLGPHRLRDCRSTKSCQKCRKRHHTLIHDTVNNSHSQSTGSLSEPNKPDISLTVKENISFEQQPSSTSNLAATNHVLPESNKATVLLATAQVNVIGPNQNAITARALIDQGSELSFISEYLAQTLYLPRRCASISLIGIGGNQSATTRGQVSISLGSIYDAKSKFSLSAYILPKLTTNLPSMVIQQSNWPHIEGLELADPSFMTPGHIDIILGADVYARIIHPDLIKGPPLAPIAQLTSFGWILSGPVRNVSESSFASTFHCVSHNDLDQQIQRFWLQEEISDSIRPSLTPEDQACEEYFKSTFKRTECGRYEVRLPFKESVDILGDSHVSAFKMLQSLQGRISSDDDYNRLYSEFIHEYENLGHMSEVCINKINEEPAYYLPHHGILRSSSSSTKLRVVFNASHRTSSGISLNDILHSGPKLQTELTDVLTWFRRFKYVFVTDIEKMYRQIMIHPDDRNFQRILWFENNLLHTYQLNTVTYGLSSAPYLALRTLNQLIMDEGKNYPKAVETLQKGRYVDDIFGGDDSLEGCLELVEEVDQICKAGCFPLKKWISNHPSILKGIESDRHETKNCLDLDNSFVVKTLGLSWETFTDCFQFIPNINPIHEITKRNVLSRIAQFFDPFGFIAPITIQAKIFMQQLWLLKLNWDDVLPTHLVKRWQRFETELKDLTLIQVPRFLNISRSCHVEIHGFSDASMSAMSAVVYVKIIHYNYSVISFVCAKTKVAPLKKISIPRLELIAATILVKLVKYVRDVLDLTSCQTWLWTDSSVALTWITNSPSRWKEFVSNRVNLIQEIEPSAHWKFVPGNENPADCASRGLSPKHLSNHILWWNGPAWLNKDPSNWPTSDFVSSTEAHSEERRQKSVLAVQKIMEPELLKRYSSLNKLLRITAWCLRFKYRSKKLKNGNSQSYLTPRDIEEALLCWIGIVQQSSFKNEIKSLQTKKCVDKSSPLKSLSPFIDKNGLVRVGGRLSQSLFEYDTKHPYILPKDSFLSKLVINDVHLRTLHGSTRDTLSTIRQKFWILGGRPTVKKELLHCVICSRYRAERAEQLMGQLPPARLNPSRPFLHSGVDYAGPFTIKTWRGRNAKTYKGYVAVFICSSTSAIHLELVTDYTSDAFISAYKRFTARRGICATISSDCGTTFTGAAAELKRLFSKASTESDHLRRLLANDGTEWRFNPPSAPHFGGRCEAAVKSFKYHLRRAIGNNMLTYEEFSTILNQIEAVLNSRPLCQLTEDPDELFVLTPAHFLVGDQLTTVPEPNLFDIPTSKLTRWKQTRQILEGFWKRWSKEYLQQLQTMYKWRQTTSTIDIGSVVLIIDERYPPSKWPLARVVQLHPGQDGLTRVVTLKTADSFLKRPIVKLCPLPVERIATDATLK